MKVLNLISVFVFIVLCGNFIVNAASNDAALRDGALDAGFSPVLSQSLFSPGVSQTYPLPDGKILVAGWFRVANGVIKDYIARLNSDGTLDNSFGAKIISTSSTFQAMVRQVAVQPDGKILIGGTFNTVNNAAMNHIARLNSDGTFDSTFNIGSGFDSGVTAVALQADGKILVGGNFGAFNGTSRAYLARLNSNGSLDNSFSAIIASFFANTMQEIVPLPDGKIFIRGRYYSVGNVSRNGPVRLNADGSLDTSFAQIGVNGTTSFAVRPDGKIYIGGSFDWRVNNQSICQNICRVNSDGTPDASFSVSFGANSSVRKIYLHPDGRLLIHGTFQTVNGLSRNGSARLDEGGNIDPLYVPNFSILDSEDTFISRLSDGRYLFSGNFAEINGVGVEALARIEVNGTFDSGFMTHFSLLTNLVTATVIQPDGKIIVAGDFNRANGIISGRLARFNPNGSLDTAFSAAVTTNFPGTLYANNVNKIVLQPDGKILVGGDFGRVNGETHYFLARLNSNGSVDSNFNPIITYQGSGGGNIFPMAVQIDGKILIGGAFQTVNGASRVGYARLNSDGSLDNGFVIPFSSNYAPSVNALLIQPDGKILIGGDFRFDGNNSTLSIARLNADGSLDSSFVIPNSSQLPYLVSAMAKQADGKILIGGTYTSLNYPLLIRLNADGSADGSFNVGRIGFGSSSERIYSIIPQTSGKILIAGSFSVINGNTRSNIARLIENGGLDFSFSAPVAGAVMSLNQTADGNLIAGGFFNQVGTVPVSGLAKLKMTNISRQPVYDFDGDGRDDLSVFRPENGTWYLSQSTAGFRGFAFGFGTDKIVPADYDGDGKTDFAVYRNGTWYLQRSGSGFIGISFGDGNDIPVPADYDGDSRAELAVFRPSNGYWYLLNLYNNQFTAIRFGQNGDKPAPADYDGDGKADIAVNRSGNWYLQRSQLGFTGILFGDASDKLVPADYDGDGKADLAVFRPGNGYWYLLQSQAGFAGVAFGFGTDIPVAADYDGDGKADLAVVRNGNWYLNRSTNGFTGIQFGASTDLPAPNAFVR